MTEIVLRSDDSRCQGLEASGWRVVATSWGARLTVSPELLARLPALVACAAAAGFVVRELDVPDAPAVLQLDALTAADYPGGTATSHEPLDEVTVRGLLARGRVFGAEYADALVGVTVTEDVGDRVETEFTVVHPDHRGRGIASAVKAASVLAHAAAGATLFGTGGASVNAASLAMNRAVGYELTETWHTYARPD